MTDDDDDEDDNLKMGIMMMVQGIRVHTYKQQQQRQQLKYRELVDQPKSRRQTLCLMQQENQIIFQTKRNLLNTTQNFKH